MGSKLSIVQRGVYYDIVSILIKSNVKFSKRKLKQFIRWLFLQFPNISPEEIHNIQFWDKVGNELITLGQSGKLPSAKFVFWSLQIRTALLKQKEMEKKPNVKPCASALPVPPSPSKTPKPLSLKKSRARVSFSESSDVQNGPQSLGGPQDGGCHVASSQTWSSSSQNPLKHSKIPSPSPSPPVPGDTFPPPPAFPAVPSAPPLYSSQGAAADVVSPGDPAPCSHGIPAPCQPLDPAPCSHGFPAPCRLPFPAPSPGSHGGDTPTACPQTCSCDPNASDSRDTEQGTADPMHGAMLSLAPVTFQPAAQAGAAPTANWSSFGRQLIKEICKSHKEYGPHSPYFRGLLNSELSRTIVVPHDLKQLFSCLMTSTEFKLWESALKQLLKDALPSLQADPNTAKDNNGNPITIDHLCGEGQWSSPSVQAAAIPAETLEKVKEAAEKAFFSLQPEGPFEPYSKIKQLPSEPFVKFVERLTRAIEIQVKKENASEAGASKTKSASPLLKVKQNNLCYDLSDSVLTASSVNEPYRLQLTESLHLKDTDWHIVSVNPEQKGTWNQIRCKYIITGDKNTPQEIEIAPGLTTSDPKQFVPSLHCVHPPLFLPKGQIAAQAIPVPSLPENVDKQGPTVARVQVIGTDKPKLWCNVSGGGESKRIEMLVDTGAVCTVIPVQDWPAHWPLQNVAGHLRGVGGLQLARQSKSIIQFEGPNGQLANIRPFVLDYSEPLLGRDLMAQWGVTINIPDSPQHFCAAVIKQQCPTQELKWKTDEPVDVKQWPLSKQKIKVLEELVQEQLRKGHIVETMSPWNSPINQGPKRGCDMSEVRPASSTRVGGGDWHLLPSSPGVRADALGWAVWHSGPWAAWRGGPQRSLGILDHEAMSVYTKISAEEEEEVFQTPEQPVMKCMMRQAILLQPMGDHIGADVRTTACGGHHAIGSGYLKEAADHGEPTQKRALVRS
ncbi:uncharacterized protein LOC141728298 [Zonotrichia albicollis]|uniref:uncharacterized protein LOC141728298 n=1 Tax=Zonotrichia albicollis TaxID=44394 RepID=UPI003D80C617